MGHLVVITIIQNLRNVTDLIIKQHTEMCNQ